MFITILTALLILAGLLVLAFGPTIELDSYKEIPKGEPDRFGYVAKERVYNTANTKLYGLIPLVIAGIILAFACTVQVPAKQVGVVTEFGKPQEGTLDSGLHLKAPWQGVTEIDATIQTDEYHGESAITVVLADKNTASISATIRWSVNEENANEVYADFRSDNPTESLRDAVVSTQFKAAVNAAFGNYDATQEAAPDYDALAGSVETAMLAKTKGLVDINDITISYIKPSEKLQAKIEAIQAQEARTRIAAEAIETARKEAEANRILSESISNDPNVLVSKCLDLMADGSIVAPAGFQCWNSNSSSVVIPSAK